MSIMSGIRGYVGGEGLWSKAQKAATSSLLRYSITSDQADYDTFLDFMRIPLGYKEVRVELDKPHPDFEFIKNKWIEVGIHPDDVNDAYFLYRNFKNVVYIQNAVRIWVSGDDVIQEFLDVGAKMHQAVLGADRVQIDALVKELNGLDDRSTEIENSFSASLAEGSRAIKNILIIVTAIFSLILGGFVVMVAIFITRIVVEVDRAKTEFISIASHQLNTPLSIMKNAYAMVQDQTLTVEQGIDYWGSGLKRMALVVEDFWNAFKLEEGIHSEIKQHDIMGIMRAAVEDKRNLLAVAKKDVVISITEPEGKIPEVFCDIKQIDNVMYNLLDNAVSYTPQGSITVSYTLSENGAYLKVSVKDTGIGFSKEDYEKLTKKFYRTKKALLRRPDGSGLGLYICKSLVESNQGTFSYESAGEGKGSVFSFTLPCA